jgi:hypothetical protein
MDTRQAILRRPVLRTLAFASAAAVFATVSFAGASATGGGPFAGLEGVWGGNGTVTYSSGTKERLRCRVQYTVAGNADSLSQALRCASDSYKFQINAIYVHQNGNITGRWDEKMLEISGTITGNASAGHISGSLHGPGFLAKVVVDTNGNDQTVTIASEGQEIRQVAIEVRKSGGN